MKTFELSGQIRKDFGKKAAKELRKQDLVPCNLYGNGDNITFTVNVADVRKLIYTPDTMVVELTIDGKKHNAVVKELQFHPVKEQLLHIDFFEVTDKKPVTVEIPVQLTGHAEGVKAGGKLSLEVRKLKVSAIYTDLPDRVVVDVTTLGLGKRIQVGDLKFDKYEIVNVKDLVVAQVKATRASKQQEEA